MTDPSDDRVDLLVRGTLVNVTTGTLSERAIAVEDGETVALADPDTDRPADREIETGYVTPGLIDAHTHVEASMVTIPEYGRAVVPRGVTSVVHDPHEIANVLGPEGVRAFVAGAERTPLKARTTVPSSVPASDLQDAGATLDPAAVESLLETERAVALGEVMNVPGVLAGEESIHAKIRAARERGLPVDGHAPGVTGDRLQAAARYLDNDHESVALEEAREKAEAGLRVYLREGSTSRNLADLVGLVEAVDARRLSLCTDERTPTDLVGAGGIDAAVETAMELGVDPVTAVQLATVNTAEAYDLPFGRVSPGAPADLVLLSDLESWRVEHVVVDGVVDPVTGTAAPAGAGDTEDGTGPARDTVAFDPVAAADLAVEHPGPGPVTVRVQSAIGSFRTERLTADVPVERADPPAGTASVLVADPAADVLPMAVVERHGGDGSIGRGFVHNLGLARGAVGTTVAHDAHNCVVAGRTHEAMAAVANRLREVGGGLCVYDPGDSGDGDGDGDGDSDENGFTTLELPVAGLVTDRPVEAVAESFAAVEAAADRIGLSVPGGLLEVTYQALEVIPTYRLTNRGLVDGETFEEVDLVVE